MPAVATQAAFGDDWGMDATAGIVFIASAVSGAVGAIVAALVSAFTLRRTLKREAARLEGEFTREEGETRAAVDRLTNLVADRSQAWFWTDEWQEGEREADKDLTEGRSIRFGSFDEFAEGLEREANRPSIRFANR